MRKLMLLILFLAAAACSAQIKLETNKEGEFRIKEKDPEWTTSDITAEPEATKYKEKFSVAISNPGEKILVKEPRKTSKLKSAFEKSTETTEYFIVYDECDKTIRYLETKEQEDEAYYLVLSSIAAIILMITLNMITWHERKIGRRIISGTTIKDVAIIIITGVTCIAVSVAISIGAITSTIAGGGAAFIALLNFAYCNDCNPRAHRLLAITYYMLMAIYLVFLFL